LSSTNNLRVWCEEVGEELGEKLLEEWDDPVLEPWEVTRGSHHRARWMCRECGWSFHAEVKKRTKSDRPSGCKACAGRVATETHNLALACAQSGGQLAHLPGEWHHPTKRMEDFTPASMKKVPWRCGTCEWEWDARISSRTKSDRPTGCPACAGMVATETNNLALACAESGGRLAHLPGEWHHPTKRMEDFTPGSKEKVPWRCGTCEWEWDARINDRTGSDRPTGCPACAGMVPTETNNLALTCEVSGGRLARLPVEWNHPTKRMEDFTPASGEKVPWRCGTCEWQWNATIYDRTRSDLPTGCPQCYRSARAIGLSHSFYKRRNYAGVDEGD
jgi:NAD-dependent SIR2 family protein deacetylase